MDSAFLGRRIRCVDLDAATRGWIGETWLESVANMPRSGARLRSVDFSITIAAYDEPPPRLLRVREADTGDRGTRHLRLGDDEFWVFESGEDESSSVHARLADGSATLELRGVPFTGWTALFAAFGEALASSGIFWLHAAAIHREGRTMALLGPSGRGKSTTLLRAIVAGWRPIAEDGCWLDVETLALIPADESLRLRPEGIELLRAVRPDLACGQLDQPKCEIPLQEFGTRLLASTLTDLVSLERSDGAQPEWRRLPPARAVMALHEAAGIPHTGRVGRLHARAFRDIVRRTTSSSLRMGAIASPFPAAPPAL